MGRPPYCAAWQAQVGRLHSWKPPSPTNERVEPLWLGVEAGNGGRAGIAIPAPQVEPMIRRTPKNAEAFGPSRCGCPASSVTHHVIRQFIAAVARGPTPIVEIQFAAIWDFRCRSGNRRAACAHHRPKSALRPRSDNRPSCSGDRKPGRLVMPKIGGIHAPNLSVSGRCETKPCSGWGIELRYRSWCHLAQTRTDNDKENRPRAAWHRGWVQWNVPKSPAKPETGYRTRMFLPAKGRGDGDYCSSSASA